MRRSPRTVRDSSLVRGGQPAGKRGGLADPVELAHELQPDDLADVTGVGIAQLVPAAD
jgi:hypothetical protein